MVMLRNKNLHLRSESQFALILRNWASLKRALHKDVDGGQSWGGQRFLTMEDGKESAAGPRNVCIWWSQMQKQVLNAVSPLIEARRARREQERVQK